MYQPAPDYSLYVNRAEPVNRAPDYVYMYEKLKET